MTKNDPKQDRELEINKFLLKCAREKDKRPWWKKITETFLHDIGVLKERFSPIR